MAKFEVYTDKKGEYRWRMRSGNGQIIATGGEGYTSKSGCENGIDSVKRNSTGDGFEVYEDAKGEYRWRLRSGNGQIIATGGEGYTTQAGCENGVASVKRDAAGAEVVVEEKE